MSTTRPDCWDFAMDFLGGPEDKEVEAYVTALEAERDALRAASEQARSAMRNRFSTDYSPTQYHAALRALDDALGAT